LPLVHPLLHNKNSTGTKDTRDLSRLGRERRQVPLQRHRRRALEEPAAAAPQPIRQPVQDRRLGVGRTVAAETEVPNMSANLS
jgi:hypothetical protein